MSPESFVRREIPRLAPAAHDHERARARVQGHALGYAEGLRDAAERAAADAAHAAAERRDALAADAAAAAAARDALEQAAASLRDRTAMIAGLAEEKIWTLAIDVAEAVLGRELSDPVHAARTALARAERAAESSPRSSAASADPGAADAVVILSAADVETLDRLGELPANIAIESSPSLSPGDAVVHLPDGDVDLRVAHALARARAALSEVAP